VTIDGVATDGAICFVDSEAGTLFLSGTESPHERSSSPPQGSAGGGQPGLVLLHHMDVVPATPAAWSTNPLQAVVVDGYLHGRGVQMLIELVTAFTR
jgi:hypothetical protein